MSFQDRYEKHETAIQKRWQPFSIEVLEKNILEGTLEIISILKKAKQSAKEIHDPEEERTYLEFIEEKLLWNLAILNQNRSAKAQEPVQSNETLNTGKRTIEEIKSDNKNIQWTGTREELRSLLDLLWESGLLAERSDIPTLAQNHFYISGNKPIDRMNFAKVKRLKKDVSRESVEQFLIKIRNDMKLICKAK